MKPKFISSQIDMNVFPPLRRHKVDDFLKLMKLFIKRFIYNSITLKTASLPKRNSWQMLALSIMLL